MTLTEYELERERRLVENKRRLEELGVRQMAEDLQEACAAGQQPKRRKRESKTAPLPGELEPVRRSKRNEGREQPNYKLFAERSSPAERRDRGGPLIKEGELPEVYGVEHVKALGCTDKTWVMFQDGYNEQGERIYDSEKGVSCHQCRQKTLGLHTTCSKCKSGLGSYCGDCLFARYGEHIEDVVANQDWVCPCCRDLCNCSRHRSVKKWTATGMLHHRVKARGYLSVAHYLVLNHLGTVQAKRAALQTGFCPPDLEEKLQQEIEDAVQAGLDKEEEEQEAEQQRQREAAAAEAAAAEAAKEAVAKAKSEKKALKEQQRQQKQQKKEEKQQKKEGKQKQQRKQEEGSKENKPTPAKTSGGSKKKEVAGVMKAAAGVSKSGAAGKKRAAAAGGKEKASATLRQGSKPAAKKQRQ